MSKTTVGSFISQFIAIVKGDDAEALAQKAWRQAKNALTTQIHLLEGETMRIEDRVEKAQEAENNAAVNNGRLIEDNKDYTTRLVEAHNRLEEVKEELAEHNRAIEFLTATLASITENK